MVEQVLSYLVRSGEFGILAFLMWHLMKLMSNHMKHEEQALKELTVAIVSMKELIEVSLRNLR